MLTTSREEKTRTEKGTRNVQSGRGVPQLTAMRPKWPQQLLYGILSTHSAPGTLLDGPPRTGKTLLVKEFAKQAQATILALSAADFTSEGDGQRENKIKGILAYRRRHYPFASSIT
jgi:SpoVK/Ycf46/Vps4 family AAA+-type ATPase